MKPKLYRKLCKAEYLKKKKKHKAWQLTYGIPDGYDAYLRLVHDNMVWEGKIKSGKFNAIRFSHER